MKLKTFIIACSAIVLTTASLRAPAQDASGSEIAVLRNTVVNLLEAMVKQGLISKDSAEKLVADAQSKANTEAAASAAAGTAAPGDVRVTYVPMVVQDQITAQVKQDVQASLVADVKKAAVDEGWGVPAALPSWVRNSRWSGDIRIRGENTTYASGNPPFAYPNIQAINEAGGIAKAGPNAFLNTTEDQTQFQVKMTLGAQFDVNENALAEVRLSTGNQSNPVTRNQALGTYDRTFAVLLDEAYVRLGTSPDRETQQVLFWAGRTPNIYQTSELAWDNDVRFNGFSFQYSWNNPQLPGQLRGPRGVFANGGAYPIQEVQLSSNDKWLLAAQLGYEFDVVPELRLSLAAGYFDYQNVTGKKNPFDLRVNDYTAPQFVQKGNTVFDIRDDTDPSTELYALAADYNLLDVSVLANWILRPDFMFEMTANYITNLGYSESDVFNRTGVFVPKKANAYRLEFRVGNPDVTRQWAWRAFVGYSYTERDALLDAFADSDFHRGGTDAEGYILGGELGIWKNTWARLRYLAADAIDGPPLGIDVLQIDLNAKF